MGVPMRNDEVQQPGTAVAVVEKNKVVALLRSEEAQRRIVPLLGHGASYDEVMAEVWLAVQANPKIMECPPVEIVISTARAVATGGRIGKDVYLVPYKGKLAVVEDYKFLARVIQMAGGARAITPGVVYEGDEFEWELGTNCFIRHKPAGAEQKGRRITHAYAFAKVRFGESVIVVMDRAEIEAVRQRYSKQWKDGPLEAIPWYGPKTCIRRLAKVLPDNPRLAAALRKLGLDPDRDEETDELLPIAEAEVSQCHGHAKELAPLAENWSRSTPLANQAEGFGYGGADETPIAESGMQQIADLPNPFGDEPAPAPAPVPSSAPEELSMAAAEALPYPWQTPPRYVGKRLGELNSTTLQRLLAWAEEQVQSGKGGAVVQQQYAEACALILSARPDAATPARPPQTAMPLPEPVRQERPDTTLRPGKVEDALAQAGAHVHQMDAAGDLAVRGGQRVSSEELGF